ncbi:MAG TPA: hypothetical protein VGH22_13920 [Candidatus Binatia bacterium]|jgi:hypothetical protein
MLYLPNYAAALRCIGQALEIRNIAVFELIVDADEFVVRCGDPNPPYTSIVTLHYSPQRITILDRDGQARRRQMKSYLRFDSLPEILRAAGNYVDSQSGQIRRLTNCSTSEASIEVEYQTRAGIKSETLCTSLIRDIAVTMFKRRTRISNPIDLLTRRI